MVEKFLQLVAAMRENRTDFLLTSLLVVAAAAAYIAWENRQNIIDGINVKQCVSIPSSGHEIIPAAPGEFATVIWRGIERTDDCGKPEFYGTVSNGDGILHDARLTTSGVNLTVGKHDEIKYKFLVPETAEPGRAFFKITINFPNVGRTVDSPRIYFRIQDK